jgi:1-deoxyxylulose-5-phosphate synthase
MTKLSRRSFLKTSVAAGALAGALPLMAERQSATEMVTLGRSNTKVTRLAFGTGTFSGRVQQQLGQEGFTKLVHYAYDRGIRFFETSESYGTSPQMLAKALKGIPRENYQIMTKVTTNEGVDPMVRFDEMRKASETDYFDIMLLHWQHTGTWVKDTRNWQDAILQCEHKQTIKSHGASVHGLPALRQVPGTEWLQIAMIRMNHVGAVMDSEVHDTPVLGNVPEVVSHVKQVKKEGMGVISMKLIGEGRFNHEDRQKAVRFAFRNAGVDCVTIGFKNNAEIDEAIDNINLAFT